MLSVTLDGQFLTLFVLTALGVEVKCKDVCHIMKDQYLPIFRPC